MKWIRLLIFFLLGSLIIISAKAEPQSDTIRVSQVQSFVPLENSTALKVHPYQIGLSLPQVKKSSAWLPFDSTFLKSKQKSCWLSFVLQNDTKQQQYMLVSHGASDTFELHVDYGDSIKLFLSGDYIHANKLQFYYDGVSNGFFVQPGQTVTLYAKVYNELALTFSHSYYLETREYYARSLAGAYIDATGDAQFHTLVIGAMIFSILFIAFLGFWFREKTFIYYILYVLGALLYILPKTTPESFTGMLMNYITPYRFFWSEGLQYFFYAAYVAFGASLLNVSRYRYLMLFIRLIAGMFLCYGIVVILYQSFTYTYSLPKYIFLTARIVSYVLSFAAIVWIWVQAKSPLKPFFMIASIVFILLTGIAAYSNLYFGIQPKPFFYILPMHAFKLAVLIDTLIFAFALGYKMFIIEKEKRSHFQSYISQLEINKQLMTDMNEQLEKTVAERTAELEVQKEKQLRLEYDQKLAQLEMQALRSQMNPHFIFNSLNSIRYQIQTAQYKNASDYLVRFSKLLRLSLENSRRETVTLTEELALTKLYLEIEGQRFGDAYQFSIAVAKEIDADEIELPPLLLQPYAENAIKHGLMNSSKPLKMVQIEVSTISGGFCIAIADNGVGRQASQQRHMEGGLEHKSLGMQITRERMQLFSKHEQVSLTAAIEDIVENGIIDGTRVIITCKNQHYV